MAGEYDTVQLGEVASVRSGFAFKSSDWTEIGIPVVKIANVKDGRLVMAGCSFVPQPVADSAAEFALQAGDILMAMTGYIGDVAMVRERDLPAVLNQRVGRFSIRDHGRLAQRFLFYLLRDGDVRTEIEGLGYGSAQPNVSPSLIHGVRVPLPPLPEQQAIAYILGTLDDKIELNRRMNETLEAMAQALFKSWFVDFDPVRAKAEGRDPGLPQPLADLFPDSFEDSELGEIPMGWEIGCVDDEFDLTMGQSPPGNTYNEAGNGLPFYQGRTDFGFRFPTRRVYCTAPTRLAKRGDTLISVRAPVGDINMAVEDCAIGRGVAAARHKTGSRSYSYQFMRSQAEVFERFEAEGTVFGSIGKKDFHAIAYVVPPRDLVVEFERRLAPVDDRIEVSEHETQTLAALRDALLPKLISGELRVVDPAQFMGLEIA
jgi:type I restriction enzyme S subunit